MRFNENVYFDDSGAVMIKTYRSAAVSRKNYYFEHHHTECEVCLCVRGGGIYTVGDKRYEFCAGDAFLFGSNEAHCITDTFDDIELLNLQFEPRILWENRENTVLLALFNARNQRFDNKFQDERKIFDLMHALEAELSEKRAGYGVAARSLVFSMLIHFLREYDCVSCEQGALKLGSSAEKMSAAMDFINENLEKKLSLKSIADVACMTPTYFSSVFKKFNGISPWEYITIKRVDRAIHMIRSTDMTKVEIAERCGFSSPSHFYKAFREITGKSPKDFVP
ncbi:MAG: helix-turn-helix domain-containing protein [Clostridia bacterium]|nr:helix-turn-helix domain-containing protein [Clostridia bacterium]